MRIIQIDYKSFYAWRNQIAKMFNLSAYINFSDYAIPKDYGEQKCNELSEYLKTEKATVFGAVENELLVGWIWCHTIYRLGRKRLHVAEIAVDSGYQKQGIGQLLLKHSERFAKENGYREIDLLVTKGNTNAVAFYEKAEYEIERYLMKKTI